MWSYQVETVPRQEPVKTAVCSKCRSRTSIISNFRSFQLSPLSSIVGAPRGRLEGYGFDLRQNRDCNVENFLMYKRNNMPGKTVVSSTNVDY